MRGSDRRVDPETAFATGLIADLGMLTMAQLEPERYMEIADEPDHTVDLVQRERESFGFDHMAVGERLMTRWLMPDELIEAVNMLEGEHLYEPRAFDVAKSVYKVANCVACHRMNNEGYEFGPDFKAIKFYTVFPF